MATCAICQQPITVRSQVRVAGTEVVHSACAATGRETAGSRLRRENVDLLERLLRERESAERERVSNASKQRELKMLKMQVETNQAMIRTLMERRDVVRAELDTARQERDQARAELAKVVTTTPDATAVQQAPEDDDAKTRFSLLELDPL